MIFTLTATPARLRAPLVGGMAAAWAAVEALTRSLSAELGPRGIRAVCLRPDAVPETATIEVVFGQQAKTLGIPAAEFQAIAEGLTHRRRLPTVAEVANAAAFVASDQASAMTGIVVNLSGGTSSSDNAASQPIIAWVPWTRADGSGPPHGRIGQDR